MSGEGGTVAMAERGRHASVRTYVVVGVLLTIITAVEVAIFYIPALHPIMVPALLTFSAAKFLIVVSFYMHLRYDSPIFRRVFFGPRARAGVVSIALLVLFKVMPGLNPIH
jgi:cytochrome c oxidase subunit 4